MTREKQTRGKCVFCGREMTRVGMSRHLMSCPERSEAAAEAGGKSTQTQALHRLLVRDGWTGTYWLHLEIKGSATLKHLDRYLRAIWLECCGHLSMFTTGGWHGDEIPKSWRIDRVFATDIELTHIYDFGASSMTLVKGCGVRQGKPLTRHPIFLMARNNPPDIRCGECGAPATLICHECQVEWVQPGMLCEEHAASHPHTAYGEPVPLFNSPRTGMCGHVGPADPPY